MREIVLWTSARPRADLAIPLAAAGTGVGQVLALLSIVLTALDPKTLFIDEPNSFLHSGAAKRLLSTFLDDPKHQYVITTHSLETLRWFDPEVVLLLKPNGDLTDIEVHEWRDLLRSRVFMSELGISYGDVTGADHCIWVEGQTEAEVFPRIARRFLGPRGGTVAFPRVSSTGHFERRARLSKDELLDISRNVTETVTLIPDTLAFIFDREARSEADRDDLKREMKGKIEFLPRYCFENYLLDAEAIVEALKDRPSFANGFNAAKIEAWWIAHVSEPKYWRGDSKPRPSTDETWRKDIDASSFLADMVASMSESRESYRKTIDSVAIAKVLLDKKPDAFKEIADIIERFLKQANPG
ncbi:MAG: AAA family ATPase [Tagaea sp.]